MKCFQNEPSMENITILILQRDYIQLCAHITEDRAISIKVVVRICTIQEICQSVDISKYLTSSLPLFVSSFDVFVKSISKMSGVFLPSMNLIHNITIVYYSSFFNAHMLFSSTHIFTFISNTAQTLSTVECYWETTYNLHCSHNLFVI